MNTDSLKTVNKFSRKHLQKFCKNMPEVIDHIQ
jgi:hypothetical protein